MSETSAKDLVNDFKNIENDLKNRYEELVSKKEKIDQKIEQYQKISESIGEVLEQSVFNGVSGQEDNVGSLNDSDPTDDKDVELDDLVVDENVVNDVSPVVEANPGDSVKDTDKPASEPVEAVDDVLNTDVPNSSDDVDEIFNEYDDLFDDIDEDDVNSTSNIDEIQF